MKFCEILTLPEFNLYNLKIGNRCKGILRMLDDSLLNNIQTLKRIFIVFHFLQLDELWKEVSLNKCSEKV